MEAVTIHGVRRDLFESMVTDYYSSTWEEMNHGFNYMECLIWIYDRMVMDDSYQFECATLENTANTCKFLKCLTATIIQRVEWNSEQVFKTTVMEAYSKPIGEIGIGYIDNRIDYLRLGRWTTSTLLEILQYIVSTAVVQDSTILLRNNLKYSSYNRLHYRNYQADSIFPKWIDSLVEQVVSGGRKSNLYNDLILARSCETNFIPETTKEMKTMSMYNLATSVVCELSDKLTVDEISVRLSMLRPGLFSLDDDDVIIDILGNPSLVGGGDRLFNTYRIFGYALQHLPHNEQVLELMVAECQLDKKEGWGIG